MNDLKLLICRQWYVDTVSLVAHCFEMLTFMTGITSGETIAVLLSLFILVKPFCQSESGRQSAIYSRSACLWHHYVRLLFCIVPGLEFSKPCQLSAEGRVEHINATSQYFLFLLCWKAAFKGRETCFVSRLAQPLSCICINGVCYICFSLSWKWIYSIFLRWSYWIIQPPAITSNQSSFSFTSDVATLWKIHCLAFVLFVMLRAHLSLPYDSVISFFFFSRPLHGRWSIERKDQWMAPKMMMMSSVKPLLLVLNEP